MGGLVKVFEAEDSKRPSMIELGCLQEALDQDSSLYAVVYRCYFDNSNQSRCIFLERPQDPEVCRKFSCIKWLRRFAENLQYGVKKREDAVIGPFMGPDIEVMVPEEHVSEVRYNILPKVLKRAKSLKAVTKQLDTSTYV